MQQVIKQLMSNAVYGHRPNVAYTAHLWNLVSLNKQFMRANGDCFAVLAQALAFVTEES